jgi:hypothetical protein
MTPERGSAPVYQTEAQGKQLPEAWKLHLTANRRSSQRIGLVHISHPLALIVERLEAAHG